MSGIVVKYGGYALGAKEDFAPYTEADQAPVSNINDLKAGKISFPNYGNPVQGYSVSLDGNMRPYQARSINTGLISKQISQEDGTFTTPLVVEFSSVGYYTSSGLTVIFEDLENTHPVDVNVKWYRNDELLVNQDFAVNSSRYFFNKNVELYNKVVFTFYSMNGPYQSLMMKYVEYGVYVEFNGGDLKKASCIQEIDPISSEISINTFDFSIYSKKGIDFAFQENQSFRVEFNGKLIAENFIKSAKRTGKESWDVKTEDYIGTLAETEFPGGIYENKNAGELCEEIFNKADVPFSIHTGLYSQEVSGYIPYTNCRDALMQVAFATCSVVDTSNRSDVAVYVLDENVSQTISAERLLQGQKVNESSVVTAVEVYSHSYSPSEKQAELYEEDRDISDDVEVFVTFQNPYHSLSITRGEIMESGPNFARFFCGKGAVLSGYEYNHYTNIHQKRNEFSNSNDIEKVMTIKDATLVSSNNIDKVLDMCYNHYIKTRTLETTIIEGSEDAKTSVGETIVVPTEYVGNVEGLILKQKITFGSRKISKDTEMLLK